MTSDSNRYKGKRAVYKYALNTLSYMQWSFENDLPWALNDIFVWWLKW